MKPLYSRVGLLVITVLILGTAATGQSTMNLRIYASPEIRISYDGNVPHEEAPITASATDANVLYASAELIYPGRPFLASAAQLYYSHDRGTQWHPVLLPDEVGGGWDNAMAAGEGGTDYFITHNLYRGLTAYSTHDGGITWAESSIPPLTENGSLSAGQGGWDREYAVVDTTQSPYAGRLYVAGEGHLNDIHSPLYSSSVEYDGVKVVSSSDGGKTFSEPTMACQRPGWHANTKPRPVVLSDGTLVLVCSGYPSLAAQQAQPPEYEHVGTVSSSDGGKTFSPLHPVWGDHVLRHPPDELIAHLMQTGGFDLLLGVAGDTVALAASPKTGIYPDRLYISWPAFDTADRDVLYIAHSDDRGVTWSAPKAIYPVPFTFASKQMIREALPMLAVNKDGIVGIAWFDERDAHSLEGYDIYFTSSADGGENFLPAVRITSQTSYPKRGLDSSPWGLPSDDNTFPADSRTGAKDTNEETVHFSSPYHGRPLGGDYSTMAVDAAGAFHPMWPDARDGTWQLYTSTIRVISPSEIPQPAAAQNLRSCVVGSRMKILMGVPQFDAATGDATFSVRLENTSSEILVSPLSVHVTIIARRKTIPPGAIWDPATGKFATSTVVAYPLSADHPLFPNGATAPEVWRLQGTATVDLRTTIGGSAQFCSQ